MEPLDEESQELPPDQVQARDDPGSLPVGSGLPIQVWRGHEPMVFVSIRTSGSEANASIASRHFEREKGTNKLRFHPGKQVLIKNHFRRSRISLTSVGAERRRGGIWLEVIYSEDAALVCALLPKQPLR